MDFYATRMGQVFFNSHLPRLVEALERIADSQEKILEKMDEGNLPTLQEANLLAMMTPGREEE